MTLMELLPVIQDETASENLLREKGILKTFLCCHQCGSARLTLIRGDRWQCRSCKAEWTRRKDSILSLVRISYSEFLLIVICFALELNAEVTAHQLHINYKTVLLLFRKFRECLFKPPPSSLTNKQSIATKVPETFWICEHDGKVEFNFHDQVVDSLAAVRVCRTRVADSATVYNFNIGYLRKSDLTSLSQYPSPPQYFWRFLNERLLKYRGTDKSYLILYLKEIEYRFNHKDVDIIDFLCNEISENFGSG